MSLSWRKILLLGVIPLCAYVVSQSTVSWSFQQPTYLFEKDIAGTSNYTCDTNQATCKVNLDFTSSVPTDEPSTHYSCLIDFGFGITGEENICNPNTVEFPSGSWNVHFVVKKIADDSIVAEGGFTVNNIPEVIDPTHVTHTLEWQSPTYLLLLADTNLMEYSCDPAKTECKINPKVTPLLDGIPSTKLTCEITADFTLVPSVSDPCNPSTSTVPTGEHTLTIKILEKKTSNLLQTRTILLKNNPVVEIIDPARVTMAKEWQSPSSLLLLSDVSLSEYSCDLAKPDCKINPKITPLLDGAESSLLTCEITSDFDIVPTTDPCNPNTSIVPIGEHFLTIKIREKKDANLLQTFTITLKNIPPTIEVLDPSRVTTELVFQQPTYLLGKEDTTLLEYSCDPAKTECKINLQLTPKLDGAESSQLGCHISSDFGLDITDCNPDTFIVPVGDHTLTIETIQKNLNTVIMSRNILIHTPLVSTGGGGSTLSSQNTISGELDFTNIQIHVQSGLDAASMCRTELCQVNFEAVVPAGAFCQWDFGTGIFETTNTDTKCNPGYVHFSADTIVRLTVTDPANPSNTVTREHPVYRSKNPETPVSSFLPKITLQGKLSKSKILTETGVLCAIGKNGFCSLNFTAADSIGAKTYDWDLGDGTFSAERNPLAHDYPPGKYQVRLTIKNDVHESAPVFFDIEVVEKLGEEFEEEKLCENDCPDFTGKLQISAALPNPPHADTVEWIEIKNLTNETLSLTGCELSDDGRSYELSEKILGGKTLRLRQILTNLSLGNTKETLTLTCYEKVIDTFSWNFSIPSSYILRREVLEKTPKQGQVSKVVDGDTLDMMIDGKKTRIRLLGVDTPETVHPRKPVEEFGKQASDFTKKALEGKSVWITYDQEPIDHYGRTLGYIWVCSGSFSEDDCQLFNANLISAGMARMERRFPFIRYDVFDDLEKEAKKNKVGLWSDGEVVKAMNELSGAEKDALLLEQEKQYLELQKELLELEVPLCEEEVCEEVEIPKWSEVTEQLTTFSASAKKSGIVTISGRTWGDFPVKIEIYQGEVLIQGFELKSDSVGEYTVDWYPQKPGEYSIQLTIAEQEEQTIYSVLAEIITPETEMTDVPEVPDSNILTLEKKLMVETVSEHFLIPITAEIVVQGSMSNNRWMRGDIFHCRSRGSCSVNLAAEVNRSSGVTYSWQLPDGVIFTEKNPKSFKVRYGKFPITVEVTDTITGEKVIQSLTINHAPIPKKTSTKKSSSNFTLDLKDVPQDVGGGAVPESANPFLLSILTVLLLSGVSFMIFRKS